MNKKQVLIGIILIILLIVAAICLLKPNKTINNEPKNTSAVSNNNTLPSEQETVTKADKKTHDKTTLSLTVTANNPQKSVKKANLYNSAAGLTMPLSVVSMVSELPTNIQNKVTDIGNKGTIFMMQQLPNKLLIITENTDNIRHNIEFSEISLDNGHQVNTTLGYSDKMKDSDNDSWDYDSITHNPIRHIKYNTEGDLEFIEQWSYNEENPIKYEMRDESGNVISLRKETIDGETGLRVEHLVYDKQGNTKINVSATYEGNDIKRFTYYNSDKPQESGSIFTEYTDGLKSKEIVYTSDLKVKNSYKSEYKYGEREEIVIYDSDNNELKKLLNKND